MASAIGVKGIGENAPQDCESLDRKARSEFSLIDDEIGNLDSTESKPQWSLHFWTNAAAASRGNPYFSERRRGSILLNSRIDSSR